MGLGRNEEGGVFERGEGLRPQSHYGNIYRNNLKNTVAFVMRQLLFLIRLRMKIPKVILDKRGLIFVMYI